MNKKEIMLDVFDYFRECGFSDIATNVKINETICDMVINYEGKPQIVIEVLSSIKQLKQVINTKDLLFEPIINLLQSKAFAISAQYYVFTNGDEYIWFQNDELGAPQNISAPVNELHKPEYVNLEFNREKLINYLQRIHETYFYGKRSNIEFLKLILCKIMVEAKLLKKEDLFHSNFKLEFFNNNYFNLNIQNKEMHNDVYSRLEQVTFSSIKYTDLFVVLDTIFVPDRNSGEIVMTRWLSDLLIKVSDIKSDSSIWDITSSGGYITRAARMSFPNIETLNFCVSEQSAILATIHEVVTGGDIRNIFIRDVRHITKNLEKNKPSHIVCAPHFGGRLSPELRYMSTNGATRFEEFCIERALDLVTEGGRVTLLLPESFFFSGGKRQLFRRRLLEQIKINTIISLPLGVIKNYPTVKICMLTFEKKKPVSNYEIYMCNLNIRSSNPDLFSANDNNYLNKIVEESTQQLNNNVNIGWTIWSEYLNESNWSPYHYEPSLSTEFNELEHPITKLKNVTLKIQRGTSLKLEKAGEIPVISPGMIRTTALSLDKLDFTTDEKIQKRRVYAYSNNIVMNNIGTHIGSSALVPSDLNETICSQHVIVIKGNDSIILPQFLVIALNSEYVQMQILKNATGTVMPSISITQLENIKIPLPDLTRQKVLVEHVYGIEKKIKDLQEQLNILANERKNIIDNFGLGGM
ncbi:restriction endonuclease subunit S [Paenibacillus lautus]|uniref:restriction endonuclease subunit S n=1 Tax=Paenibacillus lautus TaxID=1401 RepID=UPI003D2CA995